MASNKQSKHSSLPMDLLLEIFPRLPCKDIVVCKCVCRAWHDLLSDPNFSRPFTSVLLFRHLFDGGGTSYAFLVEIAADGRTIKTPLTTNIPNFYTTHRLTATQICKSFIFGSCNGLLFFYQSSLDVDCFDEFHRVYCYNPFSGEPPVLLAGRKWSWGPRWPLWSWDCGWPLHYRVGYDPSTGDIKLLVFASTNTQHAYILTVGIDLEWRRLEDPLHHHSMVRGLSFNGVYHWIHGNTYPKCLKTFHFGEEKIGPRWKLPRDFRDLEQDSSMIKLAVLNNHISVFVKRPDFDLLVIWTMEEYGCAESWSRRTVRVEGDYCLANLEGTLANGDLLFSNDCGDGLTIINLEKEEDAKKIEVCNCTIKTGKLYVAEFAPKFCSVNHCWNIQNI